MYIIYELFINIFRIKNMSTFFSFLKFAFEMEKNKI